MSVYLDCNATTPIDPTVADVVIKHLIEEFGNAGSRTHEFGARAKQAVEKSREQLAQVASASKDEVIFTSGATESNNLAILGLASEGEKLGKKHIITTAIEHKAVLEPCDALVKRGFEVTYLKPAPNGQVSPKDLSEALRNDTLLVSIMHANNETGTIQPLNDCLDIIKNHDAYFHTDAAQSFGKTHQTLENKRIDFISISAHKLFGPKGVGALIARKRGYKRPPLSALMYGGGQEKGLRPGTLPVHLIAGLGEAAKQATINFEKRRSTCMALKVEALSALAELKPIFHGGDASLPHTINFSVPGINSEAAIVALKGIAAVSNGSACTSQSYSFSHVLSAMDVPQDDIMGAIRISWCHMTDNIDWPAIVRALKELL